MQISHPEDLHNQFFIFYFTPEHNWLIYLIGLVLGLK